MSIKRLLALLAVLAFLFSMTACGDADNGGAGGNTSSGDGIKTDVTIQSGNTPVEEGLNLGGATINYAIGVSLSESMQRMILKFQNKYNCKVKTTQFGFSTYVQELAAQNAAGNIYDIVQVEGVRFPSVAIANLVEPLENTITTADWGTGKTGFNQELTNNFAWNNHLYAVVPQAGPFSPQMMLLFYNKKIFDDAGLEDPRELYNKGKWNWDTFYNLGTELVKDGVYLTDRPTANYAAQWNDATTVDVTDPAHPKANLTSAQQINALKYIQKLTIGQNKVVDAAANDDGTPEAFLQGKTAMWCGFYFDLYEHYSVGAGVAASNAFGKDISNLGVVPGPFGPDNTRGAHTVGSYVYGIGVGKGAANPKAAMAFAKFSTSYESNVNGKYAYSTEDLALIQQMADGPKNYTGSTYSDGSNNSNGIRAIVYKMVALGEDITQTVNKYNALLQNCIDVTINQQ